MIDEDKESKDIQEFLQYLKAADNVCEERGKVYSFECPICGGNATAIKNSGNGHLWSKCDGCDMFVIQ